MNSYERKLKIRSCDVGADRLLRPSVLLTMLQEAAIAHTEELGMGREKTLDRGLLWIVTMQDIRIARMPAYDEEITLFSHPGKTMHLLFPRFYEILDAEGQCIVKGSAIWSLIDENTRALVFPEKYGIRISGEAAPDDPALPVPIHAFSCSESREFTVPYSYIDLNRHMNNTRYLDLAEDCIHESVKGKALQSIRIEFQREVLQNDEITLSWGFENGRCLVTGAVEKPCFKIELTYAES